MAVCVSCAPPAPNFLPHNDGDHYGGTGSCSVCGPDVCHGFTPAPEPEHDPRPVDAQFKEVRAAFDHLSRGLASRDDAIRAAHAVADAAHKRADEAHARLTELEARPPAAGEPGPVGPQGEPGATGPAGTSRR